MTPEHDESVEGWDTETQKWLKRIAGGASDSQIKRRRGRLIMGNFDVLKEMSEMDMDISMFTGVVGMHLDTNGGKVAIRVPEDYFMKLANNLPDYHCLLITVDRRQYEAIQKEQEARRLI